eukprot:UN15141
MRRFSAFTNPQIFKKSPSYPPSIPPKKFQTFPYFIKHFSISSYQTFKHHIISKILFKIFNFISKSQSQKFHFKLNSNFKNFILIKIISFILTNTNHPFHLRLHRPNQTKSNVGAL